MANTKNPSGLSIARNNANFTCTWKIADKNYGAGLQFRWRTNLTKKGKWYTTKLGVKTTSRTITLNWNDYYPAKKGTLQIITFQVRGRRSKYTEKKKTITPAWSGWAEKKVTFVVPLVPSLTPELLESNQTKFTWNLTNDVKSWRPFVNVEWQTILVKASDVTDGSKLPWKSDTLGWATGSAPADYSNTQTEDSTILAQDSYTRWFRVRGRGARGASAWRYAKHVYAMPYKPKINNASASFLDGATAVNVEWTADANASHPIDLTTVEYCVATPGAGQTVPSGASWTAGPTSKDTGGTDGAHFQFNGDIDLDECLFVHIKVTHDDNDSYSDAWVVARGKLKSPEIKKIDTSKTTHLATIEADNNSGVPDSQLAVVFRASNIEDFVVGIIPAGQSSVTVQCPDWQGSDAIAFGVYAFQGSATAQKRSDGATSYAVEANVESSQVWGAGNVPVAPTGVMAAASDTNGEVVLTWNWSWKDSNVAELSWSQNPNAWESTDEPETYEVSNLNTPKWRISGLDTGVRWYFRVRLAKSIDSNLTYGPYSEIVSLDLSSAPTVPVLTLSSAVITKDGSVTASWAYSTTDGTSQAYAEVCEATINGEGIIYGNVIAHTTTAQHVTIDAGEWETGTTYYLCVRVTSGSGRVSDGWSEPVPITIAESLTCFITQHSLVTETLEDDDGVEREAVCLTAIPMTATIIGAGAGGTTTLVIERAADYHMDRPNDSKADGYEGETIALIRQTGEAQITIEGDDLIGLLDDGAPYRLVATVEDGLGQSAEASLDFEVHWAHQADIPTATVEIDGTVAKITPVAPEGYEDGDFCDIYRLSIDRPELIVYGGTFGTTYVDPYPAIGENGGHRIVHRTANGDYITVENQPAWIDTGVDDNDILDINYAIIDFDGDSVLVRYNGKLDNSWEKDFKETRYLGGAVQGDWNAAIGRNGTVSAVVPVDDSDTVKALRRLASHAGICHVRTQDGSSYAADVQVGDSLGYDSAGKVVEYTLTVTRVDPEGYEGMTLEEWEQQEEE